MQNEQEEESILFSPVVLNATEQLQLKLESEDEEISEFELKDPPDADSIPIIPQELSWMSL